MKSAPLFFFLLPFLFFSAQASADQIFFTNGDRVTGEVLKQTPAFTEINSPFLGKVSIETGKIEKIVTAETLAAEEARKAEAARPKLWGGKVTAGFNRQSGNTESAELLSGFAVKRKVDKENEFDIAANFYYGSQDKKMAAQRYDGFIRYAYSFLESRKAYHFFKTEGDHDRFANIDKRFTPFTGLGYWFADEEDWKLMFETGIGVTFTDYRDETESETELVLIPRLYLERRLIGQLRLTEELTAYPSLTNSGEYRFENEAALKNPITDKLDLKVSAVNEYNSNPGSGAKKHDMRLTSGLEYKF